MAQSIRHDKANNISEILEKIYHLDAVSDRIDFPLMVGILREIDAKMLALQTVMLGGFAKGDQIIRRANESKQGSATPASDVILVRAHDQRTRETDSNSMMENNIVIHEYTV